MLADENGYVYGTVGGGLVEHEALLLAADALRESRCFVHEFTLRNQEADKLGMVCGGTIDMLFQPLSREHTPLLREVLYRLSTCQSMYLVTRIRDGGMWLAPNDPKAEGLFTQRIGVSGTSYIFGGGHVAKALAPIISLADFNVVVADDRPEFANAERFPDAEQILLVDFSRLDEIVVGADDDVIIMTRGHEHDQAVLTQMLRTPARYIGMLGSQTKCALMRDNLQKQGFTDMDIARVHAPIGLPIFNETPFEIAISIVAELIMVRAQYRLAMLGIALPA